MMNTLKAIGIVFCMIPLGIFALYSIFTVIDLLTSVPAEIYRYIILPIIFIIACIIIVKLELDQHDKSKNKKGKNHEK
jgi:hypothetical protein